MKRTGLIVLIILCLIIFFSTMTAGILLTVRHVGWNDLISQSQLLERLEDFSARFGNLSDWHRQRQLFTIDETLSLDLTDIDTLEIVCVSENLIVNSTTSAGQATLEGSYRSVTPVVWVAERDDSTLKIHAQYPVFGININNLKMTVDIPLSYTGSVVIGSVSGSVTVSGQSGTAWERLSMNSVSGRILASQTGETDVKVNSVSGEIVLEQVAGSVDAKSTSGSIRVDYERFDSSSYRSISGSVSLIIPIGSSCQVSFSTVSGSFRNEGLSLEIATQTSRKLSGKIGTGQDKLDISTTSGSVSLKGR